MDANNSPQRFLPLPQLPRCQLTLGWVSNRFCDRSSDRFSNRLDNQFCVAKNHVTNGENHMTFCSRSKGVAGSPRKTSSFFISSW